MKVLFIVQGEGRGHLTQAITLSEALRASGHEVVEVLVGRSKTRQIPSFFERSVSAPVRQFESPNFLPASKPNITKSVAYNLMLFPRFVAGMRFIRRRIKESGADLVVNFYDLLTGLTYLCFSPDVPQVSIGHQYLFLHSDFKLPAANRMELLMLRLYTAVTGYGASERLALSFREMEDDEKKHIRIVPPLLRKEILACSVTNGSYIHGYMLNAGFSESVISWHAAHPQVALNFFWDKKEYGRVYKVDETLTFNYIDDNKFIESMAGCKAYATTAGFESVCEAMYLGKPIMMVPAHIEQECNAFDAEKCGAGVVSEGFDIERLLSFAETYRPDADFHRWVSFGSTRIVAALERVCAQHQRGVRGFISSPSWGNGQMESGLGVATTSEVRPFGVNAKSPALQKVPSACSTYLGELKQKEEKRSRAYVLFEDFYLYLRRMLLPLTHPF